MFAPWVIAECASVLSAAGISKLTFSIILSTGVFIMKISTFAVNKTLVNDGVWCPIGKDTKLRIARSNNEKYRNYLRSLMKPYARQIQRNTAESDAIAKELIIKATARYLLLDWEGIEDTEGNVVEYNEKTAIEYMTEYSDFYDLVSELSDDTAMFQAEEKAETIKN